jgi:acetyl esterase/lipase
MVERRGLGQGGGAPGSRLSDAPRLFRLARAGEAADSQSTMTANHEPAERTRLPMRSPASGRMSRVRGRGLRIVGLLALILCLTSTSASARVKQASLVYGSTPEQVLDVYGAETPNSPVCVLEHGGGWTSNTLAKMTDIAKGLQRQGCAVFNTDYRLATPSRPAFPMQVEDVEAATRYAIAHATAYNGNPANVIEIGSSAGGTLAGMATDRMDASQPGTIGATVTLSGPMELVSLLEDDRLGELPAKFAADVPEALGCSLMSSCETPEAVADAARWSPADQLPAACTGPWLVFNSAKEMMPRDQPEAITKALKAKGCPVTTTILPGHRHANEYWSTVAPAVLAFVTSH